MRGCGRSPVWNSLVDNRGPDFPAPRAHHVDPPASRNAPAAKTETAASRAPYPGAPRFEISTGLQECRPWPESLCSRSRPIRVVSPCRHPKGGACRAPGVICSQFLSHGKSKPSESRLRRRSRAWRQSVPPSSPVPTKPAEQEYHHYDDQQCIRIHGRTLHINFAAQRDGIRTWTAVGKT